jgi:hypothetical protein
MKLRDHPAMSHQGLRNWPPEWTSLGRIRRPKGEVGTLERALMNELSDIKIFLLINYEGDHYTGSMEFDDPKFCRRIYALLKSKIGLSIKEIGDLELPHGA